MRCSVVVIEFGESVDQLTMLWLLFGSETDATRPLSWLSYRGGSLIGTRAYRLFDV